VVEVTELRVCGDDPAELRRNEELLAQVQAMHEQSRMLGLRGIRQGITFPAITEMQVRAITTAMCERIRKRILEGPKRFTACEAETPTPLRGEAARRAPGHAGGGRGAACVVLASPRASYC
jgi:hypothetical protein